MPFSSLVPPSSSSPPSSPSSPSPPSVVPSRNVACLAVVGRGVPTFAVSWHGWPPHSLAPVALAAVHAVVVAVIAVVGAVIAVVGAVVGVGEVKTS